MQTIHDYFILDNCRWEAVGQATRPGVTVFTNNRGDFREAALGEVVFINDLFMIVKLLVAATEPVTLKVSQEHFGDTPPNVGVRGMVVPEPNGEKLLSRVWFPVNGKSSSARW